METKATITAWKNVDSSCKPKNDKILQEHEETIRQTKRIDTEQDVQAAEKIGKLQEKTKILETKVCSIALAQTVETWQSS